MEGALVAGHPRSLRVDHLDTRPDSSTEHPVLDALIETLDALVVPSIMERSACRRDWMRGQIVSPP